MQEGIIYLIHSTNELGDVYKIGLTKNLPQRVKQHVTSNIDITVVESFNSNYMYKLESTLHRYYKSKQITHEWFLLDETDVSEFKNKCTLFEDNISLLMKSNNPFL